MRYNSKYDAILPFLFCITLKIHKLENSNAPAASSMIKVIKYYRIIICLSFVCKQLTSSNFNQLQPKRKKVQCSKKFMHWENVTIFASIWVISESAKDFEKVYIQANDMKFLGLPEMSNQSLFPKVRRNYHFIFYRLSFYMLDNLYRGISFHETQNEKFLSLWSDCFLAKLTWNHCGCVLCVN